MLRELRVRDYAVIKDVQIEFDSGLTVLTGETGAGKSLVVGALSLLLGQRAASDVVRAGEQRAVVEGRFDLQSMETVAAECEAAGIDVSDGWLIVRREVHREGKNRAWINGAPATTGLIRDLVGQLVDLHGQHEHQALLSRRAQQFMLDDYSSAAAARDEVARAHSELARLTESMQALKDRVDAIRERADFLRFKLAEIDDAALDPAEEEGAVIESRRLEHSEELLELSGGMAEALYGGDEALLDRLAEQGRRLEDLVRIDPSAAELGELYETALHALEELGRRLGGYHSGVEHDPERLEELRHRLAALQRLKRKFGLDVPGILEEGARIREELEAIDTSDLELRRMGRAAEEARQALVAAAERLRDLRTTGARRLEKQVVQLLPALGMPGGQFEISLEPLDEPGPLGSEVAEFRVSLNPGFDPAPLSRVGSGGELSRVMLALKTVLAGVDKVPCLVFDEIDAGIGGRVAQQVAARLAEVAGRHQVFAVTHLPQIASRADHHLRVEKLETGERAETRSVSLSGPDRVHEIARMLGGDPDSAASLRHAEELLAGQ